MEHEFSKPMRRMKSIYSWVVWVIVLFGIGMSFLLAGIFLMASERGQTKKSPQPFDSYGEEGVYSTLDAQYMTYEFASDFKDTNHYYFVFDSSFIPYIVEIHGDPTPEMRGLIDYMYSDEETGLPAPVSLTGMSAPIDDEIKEFALESYNAFWGDEYLTESDFDDYFGGYYLDTTSLPESPASGMAAGLFTVAGLLFFAAFAYAARKGKPTRTGRRTLARYSEEQLAGIDRELTHPGARAYPKEKLYLTASYVITAADGFDIIPYGEMDRVYKIDTVSPMRIVAETRDRAVRTLLRIKGRSASKKAYLEEIYGTIKQKFSEHAQADSFEDGAAFGSREVSFQQPPPKDDIRSLIDEPAASAEDSRKSNVLLGILGAIGASLGGVALWVIVGQLGFIAGIAGFLILKLALIGYKKLGGKLDKKGAVISLFIAAVMIFGANVLSYLISMTQAYFQYDASFETVLFVLRNFGSMMADSELWNGFLIDLAVGYGLSIWSSYQLIHSIFSYKEQ